MKFRNRMTAGLLIIALLMCIIPAANATSGDMGIAPASILPRFITLDDVSVSSTTLYDDKTDTLLKGTVVNWEDSYSYKGWVRISYYRDGEGSKQTGYIPGDFVCPYGECFRITAQNGLHLRETASTSANSLGVIPYNTLVRIHGGTFSNGWGQCTVLEGTYEDLKGYVSQSYVTEYTGVYDWWTN